MAEASAAAGRGPASCQPAGPRAMSHLFSQAWYLFWITVSWKGPDCPSSIAHGDRVQRELTGRPADAVYSGGVPWRAAPRLWAAPGIGV